MSDKKILLWLDDYRDPFINVEGRVPDGDWEIVWVTNYNAFVDYITKKGMPDAISFDHDLADEHYTPEEYWDDYKASEDYQREKSKTYKENTGYDCSQWLVSHCMDSDFMELPEYHVHSANPVGADNIRGLLKNYTRFIREYINE